MKEENKKEGLLKRLKNIESKNEEQLKAMKYYGKRQLDEIKNNKVDSKPLKTIGFFSELSQDAKKLIDEFKEENKFL